MGKIIMLKGLPASGKTTISKKIVKENPLQYKRVNKDDLRNMLHAGEYSKEIEEDVLLARDFLVQMFLDFDLNVIVDDTNFNPVHKKNLIKLAEDTDSEFEEMFLDVNVDECIRRDKIREVSVGEKVIREMYDKYLANKSNEEYYCPAIIVDLDGTLAEKGDRNIYDGSKVYLDNVIKPIKDLVSRYIDTTIFIVTGRDEKYREVTEKWLVDNSILYDYLFMRKENDNRDDCIVKSEIYNNEIKDNYDIVFVLDDRNKVVKMWRSLGLRCLQVQEGDF